MTVIALSNGFNNPRDTFSWAMLQIKNNPELFFVKKWSVSKETGRKSLEYLVCRDLRPDDERKFKPFSRYAMRLSSDMEKLEIADFKKIIK